MGLTYAAVPASISFILALVNNLRTIPMLAVKPMVIQTRVAVLLTLSSHKMTSTGSSEAMMVAAIVKINLEIFMNLESS